MYYKWKVIYGYINCVKFDIFIKCFIKFFFIIIFYNFCILYKIFNFIVKIIYITNNENDIKYIFTFGGGGYEGYEGYEGVYSVGIEKTNKIKLPIEPFNKISYYIHYIKK